MLHEQQIIMIQLFNDWFNSEFCAKSIKTVEGNIFNYSHESEMKMKILCWKRRRREKFMLCLLMLATLFHSSSFLQIKRFIKPKIECVEVKKKKKWVKRKHREREMDWKEWVSKKEIESERERERGRGQKMKKNRQRYRREREGERWERER